MVSEAKISSERSGVHRVELNGPMTPSRVLKRLASNGSGYLSGEPQVALAMEEEMEEEEEEGLEYGNYTKNVDGGYELPLRLIDRKMVLIAPADLRRAPFLRQYSTPLPFVEGSKRIVGLPKDQQHLNNRLCCSGRHRHTIHLNDLEVRSALIQKNVHLMNNKSKSKNRCRRSSTEESVAPLTGGGNEEEKGEKEEANLKRQQRSLLVRTEI